MGGLLFSEEGRRVDGQGSRGWGRNWEESKEEGETMIGLEKN